MKKIFILALNSDLMKNSILVFIFIILVSFCALGNGLSIGTPIIKNYSKKAYNAGSQNWEIVQGLNGKMYFANNNGLLEFDGVHWNLYPISNFSVVRSINQTPDGKIYAGGFGEFGYFQLNDSGILEYTSMVNILKEEYRVFGEIWKIHQHADGLIFQSYEQLIIVKDTNVNVIKAPSQFHFSFLVDNNLYINDREQGLMRYAFGQVFPVKGMEELRGVEIWEIISYNGKLLIATASNGIFVFDGNELSQWENPALDFLMRNQVYSLFKTNSGDLVFGTIQKGIVIYKADGSYLNLSLSDGLQNNTVLAIGEDFIGNLWLGTDYGIDYVDNSSPILKISQNMGISAGYTAFINSDHIYLGTNQGVFFKEKEELDFVEDNLHFELLEETKGQVWFLNEIGGELICGHTNGTFSISGTNATQISDVPGGWYFLQVPGNENKMIGGCYNGLLLFEKHQGKWKFKKQFKNFELSSRSLVFDKNGILWMAHGYEGAFQIFFDEDFENILNYNFYPLGENNLVHGLYNVVNYKDKVLFETNDGLYEFNKDNSLFEKEQFLNKWTRDDAVKYMAIDDDENIWYFNVNDIQVLRLQEDGTYTRVDKPFKTLSNQYIHSFEFVYPYDKDHVFIALEDGFALYSPEQPKNYDYQFNCYINFMTTLPNDTTFYCSGGDRVIDVAHANNNLVVEYSANDFQNNENIEFSTYLLGYDEDWSDWSNNYRREFTNLYEGNYDFKVKARNRYGIQTEVKELSFIVRPPLYRSFLAYILYAIMLVFLLIFIVLFIRRRFEVARQKSIKEEKEKSRQREERLQREALHAEKEVIRMRNDQLRKTMKQKNKELANATYQMVHKNETLINLKDKLKSMVGSMASEENKQLTRKLIKMINKDIDSEKQWEIFETHFENVHEEFLKRLKETYSDLTPREMKLCAYLRMNISSKEISVLMNISTRGVEIARYRLRKKLRLQRDTNLVDFIISF